MQGLIPNWSLGFCCWNWSRNQTNCLRTQYPTRDQRYSYKRYPIEVTQSISLSHILREQEWKTKNIKGMDSIFTSCLQVSFVVILRYEFARCCSPSLFWYFIFLSRIFLKARGHHVVLHHINQCSLHPSSWPCKLIPVNFTFLSYRCRHRTILNDFCPPCLELESLFSESLCSSYSIFSCMATFGDKS